LAAAHIVALDIHPVNNLRIMKMLKNDFEATPEQTVSWMQYWMQQGFNALEPMLLDHTPCMSRCA